MKGHVVVELDDLVAKELNSAECPDTSIIGLERQGLHERVVAKLRNLIIRGDLGPGNKIIEVKLAHQLNISRTPLREALKLLEREGLVLIRPNRGAIIAPLTHKDTLEEFEVLAELERAACEYAAQRMTDEALNDLRRLQASLEENYQAGALEVYFKLNQRIHKIIAASACNSVLVKVHEGLLARVSRARYFALSAPARWDESVVEHRDILSALEERNGTAAGLLMRDHVLRTGHVISDFISSRASG